MHVLPPIQGVNPNMKLQMSILSYLKTSNGVHTCFSPPGS
jgi:hypothetical protein